MNEHGERAVEATYMGETADRGPLVIGRLYDGEGFAVLRCGGTTVKIGYTMLTHLHLDIAGAPDFTDQTAMLRALHSITCEAMLGRRG